MPKMGLVNLGEGQDLTMKISGMSDRTEKQRKRQTADTGYDNEISPRGDMMRDADEKT